jgi:hypothetical protein
MEFTSCEATSFFDVTISHLCRPKCFLSIASPPLPPPPVCVFPRVFVHLYAVSIPLPLSPSPSHLPFTSALTPSSPGWMDYTLSYPLGDRKAFARWEAVAPYPPHYLHPFSKMGYSVPMTMHSRVSISNKYHR